MKNINNLNKNREKTRAIGLKLILIVVNLFNCRCFLSFATHFNLKVINSVRMKSYKIKGYIFAIIGTLAFSNEYIFSKAALNEVPLAVFGVYWFSVSTLLIFLLQ